MYKLKKFSYKLPWNKLEKNPRIINSIQISYHDLIIYVRGYTNLGMKLI